MTDEERDALLIELKTIIATIAPAVAKLDACVDNQNSMFTRIDERTSNTYKLTEQTESHLRTLNGTVKTNTSRIDGLVREVYGFKQKQGLIKDVEKTKSTVQRILIGLAVLAGSGGLGVGGYKLFEALVSKGSP